MRRGMFFDLDGTLVDTLHSNVEAYSRAVDHVLGESLDIREGLLREIRLGKSSAEFLKELVPGITDDALREIADVKSRLYPQCLDESVLNESLVHLIKEQEKDGETVIALVTTAKRRNALSVLQHHGIQDLFDVMVFGDAIKQQKPNPEIYLAALALSGVQAEDAEAFEDTDAGIKAAEGAGIRAHRVIWDAQE